MPQKIEQKKYNSVSISQVFLSLFLLLLAFFVFLNSISSFEKNKSYDVAKSVRANFANFAGKGDNVDLIGKSKNDKINVNTVKALENTFNLVVPTIAVKKNNQSDNIEFNIPLKSFFDLSPGLPTKTAKVILNEIGGVLRLKMDKQPIKLEIFMGYRFLSNGLKLDEGLKSTKPKWSSRWSFMKMISNSPNLDIHKALGGRLLDRLKDENKNNKPVWLITFVDLISLLLAFFLMLYSMSSIQKNDWAAFLASLNKHEVLMKEKKVGSRKDAELIRPAETSKGLEISYLRTLLESEIDSDDLLKFVEFFRKGNQLVLSFPSSLIFRPGSSDLLPKGKQALFALSEKLSNLENRVELVGYSDPNPIINNQKYKNNWVLALFRASAVANALIKSGYRKPLNIVSLGDTEASRIDAIAGQKRKYRQARRVDIVIHSERDKK